MIRARLVLAVLACLMTGALIPQIARGGHWWCTGAWPTGAANPTCDGTGRVVHLNKGHAPAISFYNNATNGSATAFEHARGHWSALQASRGAGHVWNWANGAADVGAWDGWWPTVGWVGLATPYLAGFGAGWVDGNGHATQMGVQINTAFTGSNYNYQRAVACQEIGHAIGAMGHQGNGCMGLSYFNFDYNDANQRVPTVHDLDHVGHLWLAWH